MRDSANKWDHYVLKDYSFVDFAPDMLVLDVGCGKGAQLQELRGRGCLAIGFDLDMISLLDCQRLGLIVLQACAEHIPVKTASLDGIVCKVIIPYTNEYCAVREIARVLKAGRVGFFCYHGAGYYLRYLLISSSWKFRLYGLRALVNTWLYSIIGLQLPGFLGNTLYQSRRRLRNYYALFGLNLVQEHASQTFLGLPVFIYHTIQKVRN